ncbi:5-oxoprolinase subunit C family protein [Hyphococcus lacteus]|uniref:Biotin-dependent carboxyltransferase family protein n=1 Tax=Hyphococcus lacteus TaxID=3143536 RepID=A0ABV3Z4N3_9PROT
MGTFATVVQAGLSTTIQDLGRPGYRHLGVPLSGSADPLSLALANIALGNPASAPALECTLKGPTLKFATEGKIALGGAPMNATINKVPVEFYTAINVSTGDTLTIGQTNIGARCYIAFAGGLCASSFLGSASTYQPAAFGGHNGRALTSGDKLCLAELETGSPREITPAYRPQIGQDFFIRAVEGPEFNQLTNDAQERFFHAPWTVGRRADRMGIQLSGLSMTLDKSLPMASSAVFPGTVQCPPDGSPFLLSVDAQTIGGYPRIAQVIAADLPLLGQMRPNSKVWIAHTSHENAREITTQKSALIADILPGGLFR